MEPRAIANFVSIIKKETEENIKEVKDKNSHQLKLFQWLLSYFMLLENSDSKFIGFNKAYEQGKFNDLIWVKEQLFQFKLSKMQVNLNEVYSFFANNAFTEQQRNYFKRKSSDHAFDLYEIIKQLTENTIDFTVTCYKSCRLGHVEYKFSDKLSSGQYGSVFLCTLSQPQETKYPPSIAVKVLNQFNYSFAKQIASKEAYFNNLKYGFGEATEDKDVGRFCIAMPYFQGITLKQYFNQKNLPMSKKIAALIAVSKEIENLTFAHNDLRSGENILIRDTPMELSISIIDFGLSDSHSDKNSINLDNFKSLIDNFDLYKLPDKYFWLSVRTFEDIRKIVICEYNKVKDFEYMEKLPQKVVNLILTAVCNNFSYWESCVGWAGTNAAINNRSVPNSLVRLYQIIKEGIASKRNDQELLDDLIVEAETTVRATSGCNFFSSRNNRVTFFLYAICDLKKIKDHKEQIKHLQEKFDSKELQLQVYANLNDDRFEKFSISRG